MNMKQFWSWITFFIFLLFYTPIYAQIPVFATGEPFTFSDGSALLPEGGNVIAVPCIVDWDGDGVRDLLGGYFWGGLTYQFLNVGTNSQPSFIKGDETILQADGSNISVAYG
ncbi:hypothetical protein ACFL6A_01730 [bacterium]